MSLSQGLRWSGRGISNGRQRLTLGTPGARHYSLNAPRTVLSSSRTTRSTKAKRINLSQQSRSLSLFGWGPKSTSDDVAKTHSPSTAEGTIQASTDADNIRSVKASHATSDAPDPTLTHHHLANENAPEALQKLEDAILRPHGATAAPPLEEVVDIPDLAAIPESIGYLKEVCGLDFGWGPTAMMEFFLEHLHITAGLSWSSSILVIGVLFRLVLFPPSFAAAEENAKLKEMLPLMKPLQEKSRQASQRNDRATAMEIQQEIGALRKEYGLNMKKIFLPMLIQFPFQFGAFRLLSRAGYLPVPAFETEHWLWLTNISTTDPYYILPATISMLTYFNISRAQQMNPENVLMQYMKTGLPVLGFVIMSFQPSALHLFFLVNGVANQVQLTLFQSKRFRRLTGLTPLPDMPTSTSGPTYGNMNVTTPSPKSSPLPVEPKATTQDRSWIDKGVDGLKDSWGKNVGPSIKKAREMADATREKNKTRYIDAQRARWEAKRKDELNALREQRNREGSQSIDPLASKNKKPKD